MFWLVRLLLVILISVFVVASQDTAAEAGKVRDLSLYDLAGPYSLDRSIRHVEDQPIIEAAIREFLWTRWQRRRLGYLSVVHYSLEGLGTRRWYFIEPDKRGVWRIVVDEDITLPALKRGSAEHLRETHHYDLYAVERVEVEKKNDASALSIPEADTRFSEEYSLRLKDQNGQVIIQL